MVYRSGLDMKMFAKRSPITQSQIDNLLIQDLVNSAAGKKMLVLKRLYKFCNDVFIVILWCFQLFLSCLPGFSLKFGTFLVEFLFICYLLCSKYCRSNNQKQPSRGVLQKRCSEKMQKIYRRTCKATLLKSHFYNGCSAVNLQHILEHFFVKAPLDWLFLKITHWTLHCVKSV